MAFSPREGFEIAVRSYADNANVWELAHLRQIDRGGEFEFDIDALVKRFTIELDAAVSARTSALGTYPENHAAARHALVVERSKLVNLQLLINALPAVRSGGFDGEEGLRNGSQPTLVHMDNAIYWEAPLKAATAPLLSRLGFTREMLRAHVSDEDDLTGNDDGDDAWIALELGAYGRLTPELAESRKTGRFPSGVAYQYKEGAGALVVNLLRPTHRNVALDIVDLSIVP